MALIESSEGGSDPRIRDWVMRESISLAASSNGGEHRGSVDIPVGVKVEAIAIEFSTAVAGGSVDALDFGIGSDSGIFFQSGSTRVLTAGTRYFSIFEYAGLNLFDGHGINPGVRFIGDGDSVHSYGQDLTSRVRAVSAGTSVPENNARVVLYTRQEDGFTAAETTAGVVHVTVYGRRYIF